MDEIKTEVEVDEDKLAGVAGGFELHADGSCPWCGAPADKQTPCAPPFDDYNHCEVCGKSW